MSIDYFEMIIMPMLEGAKITLLLFAIVILLSIPIGFVLTLAVRSRIKPLSWLVQGFIYVMRGTPLLLQLLFICFGLPLIPVIGEYLVLDRFVAACVGFVLNYSAYFAEIFRGGLLAIDNGQYEAAKVLGFNRWQTMTNIIIPQMIRVSLPTVSNESITLVKDTSLAFALAYTEMFTLAKQVAAANASVMPLFVAGIFYYIFNFVVAVVMNYIEKKMKYED